MSIFQTLYDAHLTIGGHPITYREILGNAFGFASAIGGMRRAVWAWPVGIVGNVLLFTVFVGTAFGGQTIPLLGQAGRQVFFVMVSIYGWQRWMQTRRRNRVRQPDERSSPAVRPRWATGIERFTFVAGAGVLVAVFFWVFHQIGAGWPAPSWYFLADAWIFVGSMLATYAMARGWVDFWLCWIAVDVVGVPELIYFHLYPSAMLYGLYALLVLYGFWTWRRVARAESAAEYTPEVSRA